MNIGIIPDGNRRFAKEKNISILESYQIGVKKFKEILNFCLKNQKKENIKSLAIYVMSLDNFLKRKKEEIEIIEKLLIDYLNEYLNNNKLNKKIKVRLIGEKNFYSKELLKIESLLNKVKNEKDSLNLYLAYIYSGKKEIENAMKKYRLLNEKNNDIKSLFYYPYNLDIVIRTGKEKRISDFMNYQISYAELFFVDKYWPEFSLRDFKSILEEFKKRKRNFGK